jgi:hypothetical protein
VDSRRERYVRFIPSIRIRAYLVVPEKLARRDATHGQAQDICSI